MHTTFCVVFLFKVDDSIEWKSCHFCHRKRLSVFTAVFTDLCGNNEN